MTESTIVAMIGHSSASITGRYINNLDSILIAAADKVARIIYDAMKPKEVKELAKNPGPNRA